MSVITWHTRTRTRDSNSSLSLGLEFEFESRVRVRVCHVITDIITSQHSSLLNEQLFFITKCDRVVLQSATALFITKCDKVVIQSATAILLQSATSVITKCDRYYKVRQVLLQSATGIRKCDKRYYKVWRYKRVAADVEITENPGQKTSKKRSQKTAGYYRYTGSDIGYTFWVSGLK